MPDITMCHGDNCPYKNSCYRFTATPSEYGQSFWMNVPYTAENTGIYCDQFLQDDRKPKLDASKIRKENDSN